MGDGERVHVRLIGIDTPEVSHSGGPSECFGVARRAPDAQPGARPAGRARAGPGAARPLRPAARLRPGRRGPGRPRGDLARARRRAHAGDRPEHRPRRGAMREIERAARRAGLGLWGACARAERRDASTPTGGRPATEGPPAPGRVWQPGAANSAAPAPPPPCGRPCSVPAATIPIDDALEKGRDRGGCDRCDGLGSGSADAPEARARRAAHGPAERSRRAHGDAHLRRARGVRPGAHAHAPLRRVGGRGRARPDRAHRRSRRAPQRRSGVRGGRRRSRGSRPPRGVRLAREPRPRARPRPVRAGLGRGRSRRASSCSTGPRPSGR